MFQWRELQAADGTQPGPEGLTTWSIFPHTTKYFGDSKAGFMFNYRVDNLDALLEDTPQKFRASQSSPHRDNASYGRFAWITDPEGNRIELWEPPKS